MAVAFVKNHTATGDKAASSTTYTVALDTIVPAGNLIVARLVYDNAATASKPLVSSIGRAAGETNSWLPASALSTNSTSTTAGSFASGAMRYIRTTVAWPAGTYTVTLDTAVTQKSGFFQEFSGVLASEFDGLQGTNYSTTTTAASATTTSIAPVIGDLVIGLIFGSNVAAAMAGDNDTTGGSWSTPAGFGTTGGNVATNNFGIGQYKILTAASHQTLNNQAAMTAGNGAIVTILKQYIPPAITQAAYGFYADGTETGSTTLAAANTAITADVTAGDVNVLLRERLQLTTAIATNATDDWQLQWEKNTSGSWNNVVVGQGSNEIISSFTAKNSLRALYSGVATRVSQSFLGTGQKLKQVSWNIYRAGTGTGTLTCDLYAHSGTFGTSSLPTGTALATSSTTIDLASLSGTPGTDQFFTFDGTLTLANGTPYCIVLTTSGSGDVNNCLRVNYHNAGTHPGNGATYLGSWTGGANATDDYMHQVYVDGLGTTAVAYDSANLTDGAATTNRLGAGTGSFVAGKVSEDGLVDDLGWTANNFTELLYSLTLKSADLAPSDTLRFRTLRNGVASALADSYPSVNTNTNATLGNTAGNSKYGQSFLGDGKVLTRVGFQMHKTAVPSGTVAVSLYAHTATFGTSGTPTGAALATSTTVINSTDIPAPSFATASFVYFDFAPTVTLTNGTPYVVALEITGSTSSGGAALCQDTTSPTHAGNQSFLPISTGIWGASSGSDTIFEVYTAAEAPITYTQTPTINVTKTLPAVTQAAYRWYDEGTETGAVALAAQDTAASGDVTTADGIGQLRVRLQSTTAAPLPATDDWQLQWEKNASGTWNAVDTPAGLAESYRTINGGTNLDATISSMAQSFVGNGQKITRAGFLFNRAGVEPQTGTLSAVVYAHTGTFGSTGTPTGAALATSTTSFPLSTAATSQSWQYFDFAGTFTLTKGTPYFVALRLVGGGTGNGPTALDLSGSHPGNIANFTGGWVATGSRDLCFEVYTTGGTTAVAYNSPNLTDAAATTSRLTGGSGTFTAGKISETGLVSDVGWSGNNFTELLYALDIVNTDVVNGDTLRFRVLRNGATTGLTYTQVPTLNVTTTAAAGGKPKYYNGSTFVEKPLKVWNGSTWVEKPLKVYNGSTWVLA